MHVEDIPRLRLAAACQRADLLAQRRGRVVVAQHQRRSPVRADHRRIDAAEHHAIVQAPT